MLIAHLVRTNKHNNKFRVLVENPDGKKKTILFGDRRYEDYTQHKDPKRRQRYLMRHAGEDWTDPYTAGFWSRWVLWEKPNIYEAIRKVARRFKIKFS